MTGSGLVVPKERLENAPLLEWKYAMGEGGYRYMPNDKNGTRFSTAPAARETVESVETISPAPMSTSVNFGDYLKSVYLEIGAKASPTSPLTSSIIFPVSSQLSAGLTSILKTSVSCTATSAISISMTMSSSYSLTTFAGPTSKPNATWGAYGIL